MNFTLFGYPRTGKTTLFNILTGAKIPVSEYDAGKKEPHLRTCAVPDFRLDALCELYPDKNRKPAVIDYIDMAAITYGEMKNEAYLNHLRQADGLMHVVRGFKSELIPHFKDCIDPAADIASVEDEILLTDLLSVETRREKLDKELAKHRTPEGEREKALLDKLNGALEEGRPLRDLALTDQEDKLIRSFAFLSRKPLMHLINVDEDDIGLIDNPDRILAEKKPKTAVLAFCGKIEAEIMELEDEEKDIFQKEYGLKEFSPPRFLRASYDLLDVITFFTIGKEEVKAWTIKKETTAWDAAGEIHTDIQRGFIRAEVIPWNDLQMLGSFQAGREKGAVRLEGKDYPVHDGDVIFFRFAA